MRPEVINKSSENSAQEKELRHIAESLSAFLKALRQRCPLQGTRLGRRRGPAPFAARLGIPRMDLLWFAASPSPRAVAEVTKRDSMVLVTQALPRGDNPGQARLGQQLSPPVTKMG